MSRKVPISIVIPRLRVVVRNASVRLYATRLYDFGPFIELALNESAELLRRHVDRDRAERRELLFHLRRLLDAPDGVIQLRDERRRHFRRADERVKKQPFISG